MEVIGGILFVLFGLAVLALTVLLYFMPAYIADTRRCQHRLSIIWLNVGLGWTILGWLGLVIWAATEEREG